MANTHEHLEQAEHAEHHASDPFNQRVAVSMAIVAAILAAISMVGHRTHNRVLRLQGDSNRQLGDVNRVLGEANRVGTEAAEAEVEKSNLFAWYQSKRGRQEQLNFIATIEETMPGSELLPTDATPEARKRADDLARTREKVAADAKKRADEYKTSNKGEKNPEGDNLPDLQRRGNEAGKRAEAKHAEATKIREQAAKFREDAEKSRDEAEHVHHQADRFDIAHLSAEIGLVLCSIALLTRKRGYWFAGIASAVVAIGLTASAYTIPHHPHESHEVPASAAPDEKGNHH